MHLSRNLSLRMWILFLTEFIFNDYALFIFNLLLAEYQKHVTASIYISTKYKAKYRTVLIQIFTVLYTIITVSPKINNIFASATILIISHNLNLVDIYVLLLLFDIRSYVAFPS